ncbi:MAG: 2-hydroxyacyl-CoA dehydratase [Fimbriimonadaceae bacterium]|nr:2-hydroxyacyl-CoA dehydratase [Fimbriimonadaceae bacterium]
MDELQYFREIVTTDRRERELAGYHGRVVGCYCNFVPEELLLACGAVPVRLCSGDAAAERAAEAILPRDLCAVAKSAAGRVQRGDGLCGRADLLILPTPCDAKKKLGPVLGQFKPVHVLDLPPRKESPSAQAFWKTQIRDLVPVIERLTGTPLTRAALRQAMDLINRRHRVFRRFLALRAADPPRITGQDALFVTQASFTDDVGRWTTQLEALCERLEQSPPPAPAVRPVRLLLTGAPLIWPNHKLIELAEADGARVVIDEFCSGTQRVYQPVELRETSLPALLDAVAEKCLLPTTCPCFVDGTDRLNRVQELATTHRVDGVVYHCLRLCALFEMEAQAMQQTLRARGLPMLSVSTDFSAEDRGQLQTRVEAFVEMLRG